VVGHPADHLLQQPGKLQFLQLFQHGEIGSMPRLKDRVGCHKHRQIIIEDAVIGFRETRHAHPLADDEPVSLEYRQFFRVQSEIVEAIGGTGGIVVEIRPKRGVRRFPTDAGQIAGARVESVCEFSRRDTPDLI
jgi:hypothetical protein